MTAETRLSPGAAPLAAWGEIYAGAKIALDLACRPKVEAAAATIEAIVAKGEPVYGVNTGFGKLASARIGKDDLAALQRNIVLSHASGVGEPIPERVVRLIMALKVASLAQGASGVRWTTVEHLLECLRRGLIPLIPSQGSVGASGDLAPLAHLAAALMGVGAFLIDGDRVPAEDALRRAGLAPLVLAPKEGLALLNGTQVSTALALAGLFEAERLLGAALVTGALSTDAAKGSDGPFDARIQALRGHRGQAEAAAALRALMAGSAIRSSHLTGDDRVQDPYCLRCQPQVMGACLDLLRQAATTLSIEANGVSDNPLVFAESGEVISGGNFHAEGVAFAADMIAMALCEIGSLSERRIAMLVDPALSRLPAFLTPRAGAEFRLHDPAGGGGGARLGEQAAGLSGERRFDPDFRQSGGPCLDGDAWRAPPPRHGRECREHPRHRASRGGARMRLPRSAALEPCSRAGPRCGEGARPAARGGSVSGARHRGGGRASEKRGPRRRGGP